MKYAGSCAPCFYRLANVQTTHIGFPQNQAAELPRREQGLRAGTVGLCMGLARVGPLMDHGYSISALTPIPLDTIIRIQALIRVCASFRDPRV